MKHSTFLINYVVLTGDVRTAITTIDEVYCDDRRSILHTCNIRESDIT